MPFHSFTLQRLLLLQQLWCGAPYVALQKYFSHPSSVNYFFPNLTHKTKIRTANRWETTNSNTTWTNHHDRPIRNREHQSDHICYTRFFWQVLDFAVPFTSLSKMCKTAVPKRLCWAKPVCFDFFSSNLNLLNLWWSCYYHPLLERGQTLHLFLGVKFSLVVALRSSSLLLLLPFCICFGL
jgi:hypothetical protein